ncbi:hypothetical protein FOCG_18238 [Fusarium oxysporum f. sp. radicis-lycopersici 26381]|nr:hypothetical protein FOWG_17219 [Fusarium oxysporum f. sp. lycopersici MN25]EXL39144.1 hypothetical protein FOCG_18238 [Fusarium oxysporum f. sp. radicis-lycopersici 26381]
MEWSSESEMVCDWTKENAALEQQRREVPEAGKPIPGNSAVALLNDSGLISVMDLLAGEFENIVAE